MPWVDFSGNTDFIKDIKKGKPGEIIFKEDFLEFLGIKYVDVTDCQRFQVIDSDYLAKIGLYEIKNNYKDDGILIIEDFTNINEKLGPKKLGWFYKTRADLLCFVSQFSRNMIFVPMNEPFKNHYETIKEDFKLEWNRISNWNGRKWQSAFRRIPLASIAGYYSKYKKF